MSRDHVIVNTIGLTGAELLLAELAVFPELLTLPGQNFIQFRHALYRAHCYDGVTAEEVFDSLNLHQLMKTGRCWAGLTKSMTAEELGAYSANRHFELFQTCLGEARDFLSCVEAYAEAFYKCYGIDTAESHYIAHFGHNLTLQQREYAGFSERVRIINFGNRPFIWLAMISQRMTWNPIQALKFYIVQGLLLRRLAGSRLRYLSIDLDELVRDRSAVLERVRQFLGLQPLQKPAGAPRVPGFIKFDPGIVKRIERDAAVIESVYRDHPVARLASSMDEWADACISQPQTDVLLEEYLLYWNSTAHTNFDWIGALEEMILAQAPAQPPAPARDLDTISMTFYQDHFDLHSDNFENPSVRLRHSLGSLEKRIIVPTMPYFVRAVIAYLTEICRGYLIFTHSYSPVRAGYFYTTLQGAGYQACIDQTGIRSKLIELEALIDEVENKVNAIAARPLRLAP